MKRSFALFTFLTALAVAAWFVLSGGDSAVDPPRAPDSVPRTERDDSPPVDSGSGTNREAVSAEQDSSAPRKLDAESAPTIEGSRIRGRVVDEFGQPLTGVRLELFAIEGSLIPTQRALDTVAISGADGGYEFGELPRAARYLVLARADGKAQAAVQVAAPSRGEARDGVEVRLEPALAVFGRIAGTNAAPLAATVTIESVADGVHPANPPRSVESGPTGEYRCADLGRSVYRLRAEAPGFVPLTLERSLIALTLRREMRVDFTLEPAGLELIGRVVASEETPVADATIEARADDHVVTATSATDGRFRLIGLADREYTVNANAARHHGESMKVRPGARDVVLRLTPNGGLSGTAQFADGAVPDDLVIDVVAVGNPDRIVRRIVVAGARFEVPDLTPGRYSLLLEARDGAPTRSAPFDVVGGAVTECGTIELAAGGSVVATLADSARGATLVLIDGDVSPGNPAWSQLAIFALPKHRVVARDATARFDHVVPGTYTLFALAEKGLPSIVRGLIVRDGETTDAGRIAIESGAAVVGRVLDALGTAQIGQPVVARGDSGASRDAVTDAEGYFAFPGLEPGEWTFELGPGAIVRGTPRATRATVAPGACVEVEVRVYP